MKKIIALFSLLSIVYSFHAQKTVETPRNIISDSKQYKALKSSGDLGQFISSGKINVVAPKSSARPQLESQTASFNKTGSSCYGYTPPNPGADTTLNNVDDQGTGPIPLPFNFCLYGTNYNSCYINSNGNVTFGTAFTPFTATPFPSASIPPMLAPFWGDVDTQLGNGVCYYEVFANAAIFHWVDVGYFNQHGDKRNTFQLIITDFTSPLLQPGANVGFFYDDMNWTTGDQSGGTNGFGGSAATVGVNEGNGVDYIQIGLFDGPGNAYDGPMSQNDSVDWLDNKTFMFDVCNSNNLPPIVAGIDFCDTLRVCVGDTFPVDVTFLAPEVTQTIWASADTTQASGFQIVNNTSGTGSSAQINAVFIGDSTNLGVNIITYEAYDNGTPADTISFDYIIIVDSMPFIPIVTGDTIYCEGDTVTLNAGSGFDSYLWSNADTTQTTYVTQGANYAVTASLRGCSFTTDSFFVAELSAPIVEIIGDTLFCPGDSVLLNATTGFPSYLWSSSVNDTLDSVYVTQGVFTVTVADTNGCLGTSNSLDVKDFDDIGGITGDTTYCVGDSVLLDAGSGFSSYLWNNGDTTQTTYVTQGTHTVDVTLLSCIASHLHTVSLVNVPIPIITGDTSFCLGDSTLLDADAIGTNYDSVSWDTSPIQTTQTIYATQGTYTVSVFLDGCPAISQPFTVSIDSLPQPIIVGNLHYCSNDSNGTTLGTVNNYSQYIWSNTDTTATTIATSGNITVTVFDTNGCYATSPAVNVISSAPNDSITGIVPFCPGNPITISAIPGFSSYLWNTGGTTNSISAEAGGYSVLVTDAFGCTDFDTITLVAEAVPTANFTISPLGHSQPNQPVTFTDSSSINSGNINSWIWDFDVTGLGGANPMFGAGQGPHVVEYSIQGTYSVSLEITSDNGCVSYISREYLIVEDILGTNIITPNGMEKMIS